MLSCAKQNLWQCGRTPDHPLRSCYLSTWCPKISFIQVARHRKSSLYGQGIAGFWWIYSEKNPSHITLRSFLLALCFDPTMLIEIAVYPAPSLVSVKVLDMQGKYQTKHTTNQLKRATFWIGLVPSTTFTFCRYSSIIAFLLSFLYVTLSTETKQNKTRCTCNISGAKHKCNSTS